MQTAADRQKIKFLTTQLNRHGLDIDNKQSAEGWQLFKITRLGQLFDSAPNPLIAKGIRAACLMAETVLLFKANLLWDADGEFLTQAPEAVTTSLTWQADSRADLNAALKASKIRKEQLAADRLIIEKN